MLSEVEVQAFEGSLHEQVVVHGIIGGVHCPNCKGQGLDRLLRSYRQLQAQHIPLADSHRDRTEILNRRLVPHDCRGKAATGRRG